MAREKRFRKNKVKIGQFFPFSTSRQRKNLTSGVHTGVVANAVHAARKCQNYLIFHVFLIAHIFREKLGA